MIYELATVSVATALFLDTASYWRQIKKTIRTKRSSQISTTSFLYKIGKAFCAMLGLAIYKNFVGLGMEIFMLVIYIISLAIVIRYKPKKWKF